MPRPSDPHAPLCHEFPFLGDVELFERSLTFSHFSVEVGTTTKNGMTQYYNSINASIRMYWPIQLQKKHRCFENTPRLISSHIPQLLSWHLHWWIPASSAIGNPEKKIFLTWWPWPLTYDLDLQTWPTYPSTWPTWRNSGLFVCPFGCESGNTHTMSKLLHPSLMQGVIMYL